MQSPDGNEQGRVRGLCDAGRSAADTRVLRVANALEAACARVADECGDGLAVAFSGGLDSALLALYLSRRTTVSLYVAGARGCSDFTAAASAAQALGLPLSRVEIDTCSLAAMAERVESVLPGASSLEVAVVSPMAFVCHASRESMVVTGTGADELFGGYARYERMAREDVLLAMRRDYEALLERGAALERSLGAIFGRRVAQPYLDPSVRRALDGLDAAEHFQDSVRKALLRRVAAGAGLNERIWRRPKKAAQYGSGVTKMLAKVNKAQRPLSAKQKGY